MSAPHERFHKVASVRVSWRISSEVNTSERFEIRPARVEDVPIILELIRDLATYERAPHEVTCGCFVRRTAGGGRASRV